MPAFRVYCAYRGTLRISNLPISLDPSYSWFESMPGSQISIFDLGAISLISLGRPEILSEVLIRFSSTPTWTRTATDSSDRPAFPKRIGTGSQLRINFRMRNGSILVSLQVTGKFARKVLINED